MGFDTTANTAVSAVTAIAAPQDTSKPTWLQRNETGLSILGNSLGGLTKIGTGFLDYRTDKATANIQSMNADQLDEEAVRTENQASNNIARARYNEALAAHLLLGRDIALIPSPSAAPAARQQ